MAKDHVILHPNVMWAQRHDSVYVTINLEDCKQPNIVFEKDKLSFRGSGGTDKKEHEFSIVLFDEITPEECKYCVQDRNIPIVLKKATAGPFWSRLSKNKQKLVWLVTDWNKWKDEGDSDYEEKDFALEQMMQNMGNYGGGAGMDDDFGGLGDEPQGPDSDDESLPDLEEAAQKAGEPTEAAAAAAAADEKPAEHNGDA